MKKYIIYIAALLLAVSVAFNSSCSNEIRIRADQFLDTFDTPVSVTMHTDSSDEFNSMYKYVHQRFRELHKEFDKYNSYEGVNNVRTINENAGIMPVIVSPKLFDMIEKSVIWYYETEGKFNIALGPVLEIWHDYRESSVGLGENPPVPEYEKLRKASAYTSIEDIILDSEKREVFLSVSGMKLDVGAIAKGFAAQIVADELSEMGYSDFAINAGGNIVVKGSPVARGNDKWIIGIQNPDTGLIPETENTIAEQIEVKNTSIVTSGIYERFFESGGVIYHHVIDPDTLFPLSYFKSVTIVHPDSGISDIISTYLMLIPLDEGLEYIESKEDAMALWILNDNTIVTCSSMEKILRRD